MSDDDYNDEDRFSGRVRRYARVTGAVGGLAARLAGQRYLGLKLDRGQHADELRQALGGLRGPLMKVAQIIASVPDALPEEYVEELRQLQSNAPPMGWPFVKRRMSTELGPSWQARFKSFGHKAVAAASLGQVHKAELADGSAVACKLQYPDMASAVEADLRQLDLVFRIYRQYDRAIDPTHIHAELAARLREELDYEREAKHIRLYADMLASESGVHLPQVVEDLSTDRLLTMSWLDGVPLLEVKDHDQAFRNKVAYNMFRAWYVPFYYYGIIHGDPHLGNYSVRADGTVNLLDFGCIRVFPPSFVKGVIDLYAALRDDDMERAVEAYRTWGFTGLTRETIEVLNLWARFVYKPLMEDRPQRMQESNSTQYGATVVSDVHRKLREVGGVRPPREFVLMDRAAIGLGSVFMHLQAEINWYQLFHDLIRDFDVDALAARQRQLLAAADVPDAA